MLKHRVIPCLLIRNGVLVKTQMFTNPKYLGDPINAIRIFNEKEVDELVVLDITASKSNCEPDYALIEQFAGECFMPLAYGGGIQNVEQARRLFALGVEKVCLQTAALRDLSIITCLAEQFGNQSIIASVDVKKNWLGKFDLYSSSSGKKLKQDWCDYLMSVVQAGAGEILLNCVDRDGMMLGMDLELISKAARSVSVPVVAVGGAGSLDDVKAAVDAGASAVAAGSMFVFYGKHRAVLINYPKRKDLEEIFI